jgi:hypothetical protein
VIDIGFNGYCKCEKPISLYTWYHHVANRFLLSCASLRDLRQLLDRVIPAARAPIAPPVPKIPNEPVSDTGSNKAASAVVPTTNAVVSTAAARIILLLSIMAILSPVIKSAFIFSGLVIK